jgi:hypothetical protein
VPSYGGNGTLGELELLFSFPSCLHDSSKWIQAWLLFLVWFVVFTDCLDTSQWTIYNYVWLSS